MQILFAIAGVLMAVFILSEIVRFGVLISKGAEEIQKATRFEQLKEGPKQRIVVVGDSTAYGTGSSDPRESVAGRLGSAYPESELVNRGINGLQTEGLLAVLEEYPDNEAIDLLLIQIGGNDILRFTPLRKFEESLRAVLQQAEKKAKHVVVMSTGNVGVAPPFSPLVGYIYEKRTRSVRDIFLGVTKELNVPYIDLFEERENDLFVTDPQKYYSPDQLHPSGAGYGVWFEEVLPVISGLLREK